MQSLADPVDAVTSDVDIDALIDNSPISLFQLRVLLLCLAAMILEGYNTYAVSYVGPQLSRAWSIAPSALGVVLTAGIIGSAFAYLGVGPIADRFGRRRLIVGGVIGFGLASLVSATATSMGSFIVYRVVGGLALGVTLPSVVALVAEYAPVRWRGFSVVILYSGFAIGASTGGALAAWLVPQWGWESIFIVGGAVSLLLALAMLPLLPESLRFLVLRHADPQRYRHLVARFSPAAGAASRFHISSEGAEGSPLADLFREGRTPSTLMIWTVLAMNAAALDALVLWVPTLAAMAGADASAGIGFTVTLLIAGIFGAYLVGYLMDRVGAYRVLVPVLLLGTVATALLGMTLSTPMLILAVIIGVCLPGGTSGVQGLLARLYPTAMRATGVGWAVGVGRFVGLGAPLTVGALLAMAWSPGWVVILLALPPLVSALALLGLARDRFGHAAAITGRPA